MKNYSKQEEFKSEAYKIYQKHFDKRSDFFNIDACAKEFYDTLDNLNLHYFELTTNVFTTEIHCKNIGNVIVIGGFEYNEESECCSFQFGANLGDFCKNKPEIYKICSDLNSEYPLLKFYLQDDEILLCYVFTYFEEDNCEPFCSNLIFSTLNLLNNEIYPKILRKLLLCKA